MANYQMMNLREEINYRRGGEDSRTTIDRNHEKHRDIKGHNLKRDFACMHQWVRAKLHMCLSPLAPWEFRGGGGA
jgi:hypothetical protein